MSQKYIRSRKTMLKIAQKLQTVVADRLHVTPDGFDKYRLICAQKSIASAREDLRQLSR